MARVSLIICDLCKNNTSENNMRQIVLVADEGVTASNEICQECHDKLFVQLTSDGKQSIQIEQPKQSVAEPLLENKAQYESVLTNSGEEIARKVPSRFDKRKAQELVDAEKGSCAHHFKSWEDGAVVCSDAPNNVEGEFANFKGCGKKLSQGEY